MISKILYDIDRSSVRVTSWAQDGLRLPVAAHAGQRRLEARRSPDFWHVLQEFGSDSVLTASVMLEGCLCVSLFGTLALCI